MEDIRQRQVDWYRVNGRYPALRIVRDSQQAEYVIGDWSWSRMPVPAEVIEPRMDKAIYQGQP